jgi:hypothetical protein
MDLRVASLAAIALCAVAACSSPTSQPACGARDAAVFEVGIPTPPGCPPAQANELGVGKPCGMCGNDCASPLHCTCDSYLGVQLTGLPCVCTLVQLAPTGSTDPCGPPLPSNFCGSNATCCSYVTTAAYCVPNVCLPGGQCVVFVPIDGGTD